MTRDQVDAALRTKGSYLSSVQRLAPEMGFMAASRPLKGSIVNGDAGFGQTEVLAMRRLLDQHGLRLWPADLDDLIG